MNHVTKPENYSLSAQASAKGAVGGAYPRTTRCYLRFADMVVRRRVKCRLYQIWDSMKKRCEWPGQNRYERYGGRGIRVCDEWQSYDTFRAWAISHGYGKWVSLDRVDNDGHYEPNNCRWIPAGQQQWNSSRTIHLTLNGVTKPLPQWADELGLSREILRTRRSQGWTDEQILTTPRLTNGQVRAGVQHQPRGRRPRALSSSEGRSND